MNGFNWSFTATSTRTGALGVTLKVTWSASSKFIGRWYHFTQHHLDLICQWCLLKDRDAVGRNVVLCAPRNAWVLKVSLRWFLQYVSVNKIKSNPCTSPESHFQIFIIFQVHDSQSKFSFVSFSMFHLLIYQGHLASLLSSPPNQTFLPISQSILTLPQASHTPIMPINAGARSQRAALWPLLPAFRSVRNSVAQVCDRWALVEKLWPNKLQLSRGQCVREHWLWCYFWQGENQGRGDGSWR